MNDTINIECGKKTFTLKKLEYARWLCLIEALDLVERKAQELKTDIVSDDFWVKPLAFQKYIDQRLETMIIDVDREEFNISAAASIEANKSIIPTTQTEEQVYEEDEVDEPSEEELISLASN